MIKSLATPSIHHSLYDGHTYNRFSQNFFFYLNQSSKMKLKLIIVVLGVHIKNNSNLLGKEFQYDTLAPLVA